MTTRDIEGKAISCNCDICKVNIYNDVYYGLRSNNTKLNKNGLHIHYCERCFKKIINNSK